MRSQRAVENKIGVGDVAPDFTLPSQSEEMVRLWDLLAQRNVVLYFYPKNETPVCTAQACAFRDSYEVFTDAGAEVVGISSDSTTSHSRFASNYHLPFILLSDRGREVRRRYGVPNTLGTLPGRATYVIDREGTVRHVFSSQFNAARHVAEALSILRKLS
jgi:peroxiredoxin Q/BCP